MSSDHPNCNRCGAAAMIQTSGRAKNKWARAQCSNYGECGMQTPQISGAHLTLPDMVAIAWARWDRKA